VEGEENNNNKKKEEEFHTTTGGHSSVIRCLYIIGIAERTQGSYNVEIRKWGKREGTTKSRASENQPQIKDRDRSHIQFFFVKRTKEKERRGKEGARGNEDNFKTKIGIEGRNKVQIQASVKENNPMSSHREGKKGKTV